MRIAVLLPLLALLAVAQAVSFADVIKEEWHTFKVSFPGLSMDYFRFVTPGNRSTASVLA